MAFNTFQFGFWIPIIGLVVSLGVGIGLSSTGAIQVGFIRRFFLILGVAGVIFFGYVLVVNQTMPGIVNNAMKTEFKECVRVNKPSNKFTNSGKKLVTAYISNTDTFDISYVPYNLMATKSTDVKYVVVIDKNNITLAGNGNNNSKFRVDIELRVYDSETWEELNKTTLQGISPTEENTADANGNITGTAPSKKDIINKIDEIITNLKSKD